MIPAAVAWVLAGWLAVALAYQVLSLVALGSLLRRRPGTPPGKRPSATFLVPIYRVGPRTEAGLEALASSGIPLVCGVEDRGAGEEAGALVRRIAERRPDARMTLFAGPAAAGWNRKVANLIRMLPAARGEILILVDDDVTPPPGYPDTVLAPFADPRVGLVTCAYRARPGPGWASRLDALLTNTGFLPSVALAPSFEGVRFGLGATIAVRRGVLDEVGGLEPLLDRIADDHALAERIAAAGHRLVLAPVLLDHRGADTGWRPLLRRQVRWARTIRAVRPLGYLGTLVTHGIVPAMILAFRGGPAVIGLPVWLALKAGAQIPVARALALGPVDLVLLPLADLVAFGVFVAGWLSRTVRWGGYRMRVGAGGIIREATPDRCGGVAALAAERVGAPTGLENAPR